MHAKLSNAWHAATGKGHHIIECTLCIKDTSLFSVAQRFPCIHIHVLYYDYGYIWLLMCEKSMYSYYTINNYDVC